MQSLQDVQSGQADKISEIEQTAEGIKTSVRETQEALEENYSTTEQMNSAIEQKAESITSTVSSTYATKAQASAYANNAKNAANSATDEKLKSYSTTVQMTNKIEQTAEALRADIEKISVGGRNLIRNSEDLLFENYYFTGKLVATHDGAGNVTVVSGASAFAGEDGHVTIKTAASVSHDGAGNVTITG